MNLGLQSTDSERKSAGSLPTHMLTPVRIYPTDEYWVAHALALDLVYCDKDPLSVRRIMKIIIEEQVSFGYGHGLTLMNAYFAAPKEYWEPPFEFFEVRLTPRKEKGK